MVKKESTEAKIVNFGFSHLKMHDLGYILYRNLFLFTNGILLGVVVLLYMFGDRQAALFLGIISVINVLFGLAQDINAWVALEKLQLLTAPRVERANDDGTSESVLNENISKGDKIRLKIGDQVPCDSLVIESLGLEINEGLITGESHSKTMEVDARVLAGSVVTAGSGLVLVETVFRESRISRMTEGIRRHTNNLSPIQSSVRAIVKYSGYVLLVVIIYICVRGILINEPILWLVKSVGAMSSLIVPAGLIFAITLFFAYGAAHLFRRHVLLQEVSATEKLGRIKNLCLDKTGTLTENILTVEKMYLPGGMNDAHARRLVAIYSQGTKDASQVFNAINRFNKDKSAGEVVGELSFSSWRQYGAVSALENKELVTVLAGSSDAFLPRLESEAEKKWLEDLVAANSEKGKHILVVVRLVGADRSLPADLEGRVLALVAVFVFQNNLRQGIGETINFFQSRGVSIRIISGDHRDTVSAIARQAGILNIDKAITGKEMASWSDADFLQKTKNYYIFSRIVPEQKEKIIVALKSNGFTAMIGDGANDALAIKKADLGIAMFDGAPATRKLASVVLMNNSFAAMPGGVELADTIIGNLEIFSSLFLNISFVGLFLFIFLSSFNFSFPLTPLNVTIIDYFTIGIPGVLITYWAIRPSGKARAMNNQPFLRRVLPFTILSALFQAFAISAVYWFSPNYLKSLQSNILVIIEFIIVGVIFFIFSLSHFRGKVARIEMWQVIALVLLEILFMLAIFDTPFFTRFFDLMGLFPDMKFIVEALAVAMVFVPIQYYSAKLFIGKQIN